MNKIIFPTIDSFLSVNADRFNPLGQKSETTKEILALFKGEALHNENLVALHGLWAHEKALAAGLSIHSFLVCPSIAKWPDVAEISNQFMRIAEHCYTINKRTFARISDYGDPDGIISLARLPMRKADHLLFRNDSVVFILDGLVKPGNIGVILRACDGAGVSAVMICHLRTRVTHPNAIKGSLGAAFSIPIIEFDDAGSCKKWLVNNGFTIYIADPNANNRYDKLCYTGKIAVVFGNEHKGASRMWYDRSTRLLSIPMNGTCDSLNVSVAAAILAYEIQSKKDKL